MKLKWQTVHVTKKVQLNAVLQRNISTIVWISIKFGSDIHGDLRMNPNNFGDPFTFSCVTPADVFNYSVKYFTYTRWMGTKFGTDSCLPDDESYWLQRSPDFPSNANMRLTFMVVIEMSQKALDGLV